MTALKKYQRLECPGLWREDAESQRRDVIVAFGDASLVLSDPRSETPMTHWSLPALTRVNPGERPALFTPSPDAGETLEIEDDAMIEALETVRGAIESRRPRPGRLRGLLTGAVISAILALGVFWLPGALVRHTAQVVPPSKRHQIGEAALADLTHVTGTPCTSFSGRRALDQLSERLFGPRRVQIAVVPDGPVKALALPGGILVIRRDLIEDYNGPEVLAGYLLAARARASAADPLIPLLRYAGLRATAQLLTTGNLPDGALRGYGATLLRAAASATLPRAAALAARFRKAGVPTKPFADTLAMGNAARASLLADDPYGKGPMPPSLMSDDTWVGLQGICGN